jgi:hypothetical protein
MTVINRKGFEQTSQGLYITKDVEAQLAYTLDWSEWLETGDSISTCTWTIAARVNDPTPITKVSDGIVSGTKTYIELAGGQAAKTYVITAKVTTADGLVDRRNFRVNVENRSA